jgi:hypothetical protein
MDQILVSVRNEIDVLELYSKDLRDLAGQLIRAIADLMESNNANQRLLSSPSVNQYESARGCHFVSLSPTIPTCSSVSGTNGVGVIVNRMECQ